MIAVNLDEGKLYRDGELKDRISAEQDYGALVAGFRRIADLPDAGGDAPPHGRAQN
jgi:glutamate synthase (NADPH/NADH) large chain